MLRNDFKCIYNSNSISWLNIHNSYLLNIVFGTSRVNVPVILSGDFGWTPFMPHIIKSYQIIMILLFMNVTNILQNSPIVSILERKWHCTCNTISTSISHFTGDRFVNLHSVCWKWPNIWHTAVLTSCKGWYNSEYTWGSKSSTGWYFTLL